MLDGPLRWSDMVWENVSALLAPQTFHWSIIVPADDTMKIAVKQCVVLADGAMQTAVKQCVVMADGAMKTAVKKCVENADAAM